MARPMPRLAPVTRATLPARSFMFVVLSVWSVFELRWLAIPRSYARTTLLACRDRPRAGAWLCGDVLIPAGRTSRRQVFPRATACSLDRPFVPQGVPVPGRTRPPRPSGEDAQCAWEAIHDQPCPAVPPDGTLARRVDDSHLRPARVQPRDRDHRNRH